jgi:hypothetical protein
VFGWKQVAKDRLEQINYLKSRIKELEDQNLAIVNRDAFWDAKTGKDYDSNVVSEPTATNPLGHIVGMEAETEQDIEDKKQAMHQINQIMGASTSGLG